MSKLLSVIVPCYNEEETVLPFYEEVMKLEDFFLENELEMEIIYVDDGSKDKTLSVIKELHEKDNRVHVISFSRNFGKEAGIFAGFQKAAGDYVVMM
ncbi:MAG: glycosyltransferase, partial [Clostridium sp.]